MPGQGYEVWTHWGISKDVLCAGKEETFEFVENVLAEVLDLFPSKFIHVGGDECPKERWKECPACQRRIREEGLANENELQSYFMHRVEKWLHEHGRELIGWDEIMQGGISKSAVIMAWTDQFRGTDAARKGNRVIMTPKWNCYLDYSQTSDPEKYEPIGPTRYLSMRQVYRLDPYDRLKPAEYRNILGIQGNVWTEYIADFGHVQQNDAPQDGRHRRNRLGIRPEGLRRFRKTGQKAPAGTLRKRKTKILGILLRGHRVNKAGGKAGRLPTLRPAFPQRLFGESRFFSTFTQSYDTPCQITNTTFTCG